MLFGVFYSFLHRFELMFTHIKPSSDILRCSSGHFMPSVSPPDLASAMIVDDLEISDVAVLLHHLRGIQKLDHRTHRYEIKQYCIILYILYINTLYILYILCIYFVSTRL